MKRQKWQTYTKWCTANSREQVVGGADGHVVGLNGSINPRCVEIVLTWMEVNGKAVLDFGCASGMFLVCCSLAGARGIGVELPDNKGQKYIFDAACK